MCTHFDTLARTPGLADQRKRSIPSRLHPAISALGVFAFGVVQGASAQEPAKPQEVPAVVTAPSPAAPALSATASWQQLLVARVAKVQRYPARAHGAQGVVSLAFTIDRHGEVVSSKIVRSSESAILDAEALDLIKRAKPLPPRPVDIADSDLSFVVPIRFAAR
jgi:protein TonB